MQSREPWKVYDQSRKSSENVVAESIQGLVASIGCRWPWFHDFVSSALRPGRPGPLLSPSAPAASTQSKEGLRRMNSVSRQPGTCQVGAKIPERAQGTQLQVCCISDSAGAASAGTVRVEPFAGALV